MLRTGRSVLACLSLLVLAAVTAGAQEAEMPQWPQADPVDVESIDAIMAAVYDAISGPAGPRDWDRFRSMFIPEARLIVAGKDRQGQFFKRVMSVEDYIRAAGPSLEASGFFEREIARTTERFGPVVHAFSTYESRRDADDPEPFSRGINSFQLMHDGERWWVVTIYWTPETPELPIPERYLP